jgi:hypothetical protein
MSIIISEATCLGDDHGVQQPRVNTLAAHARSHMHLCAYAGESLSRDPAACRC